ncbi:MAG: hypothetical protein WCO77_10220 [bacterium]
MSRDPINDISFGIIVSGVDRFEDDEILEYEFINNEAINQVDCLGLRGWGGPVGPTIPRTFPGYYPRHRHYVPKKPKPKPKPQPQASATPNIDGYSFGGGGFYVFGIEVFFNSYACCENNVLYRVNTIKISTGLGISGKVGKGRITPTIPHKPDVSAATPIGDLKKCPESVTRSVEVVFDVGVLEPGVIFDMDDPSLGGNTDYTVPPGLGVKWVYSSETVISKEKIGCCISK